MVLVACLVGRAFLLYALLVVLQLVSSVLVVLHVFVFFRLCYCCGYIIFGIVIAVDFVVTVIPRIVVIIVVVSAVVLAAAVYDSQLCQGRSTWTSSYNPGISGPRSP